MIHFGRDSIHRSNEGISSLKYFLSLYILGEGGGSSYVSRVMIKTLIPKHRLIKIAEVPSLPLAAIKASEFDELDRSVGVAMTEKPDPDLIDGSRPVGLEDWEIDTMLVPITITALPSDIGVPDIVIRGPPEYSSAPPIDNPEGLAMNILLSIVSTEGPVAESGEVKRKFCVPI